MSLNEHDQLVEVCEVCSSQSLRKNATNLMMYKQVAISTMHKVVSGDLKSKIKYFLILTKQKVDLDNLKKSKSIGGSLKRLFNIKKTSKKYEGSVHETARPGSPNAISITVSR